MSDDELKITTHTIKGLSGNIGAKGLYKVIEKLDNTQDKNLIPIFYKELNAVLDELKTLEKPMNVEILELVKLNQIKRDELFLELKEIVKTKKPKKCEPILEEIEKYQ